MSHTDIVHVLKSIEICIGNRIYYLPIFIFFLIHLFNTSLDPYFLFMQEIQRFTDQKKVFNFENLSSVYKQIQVFYSCSRQLFSNLKANLYLQCTCKCFCQAISFSNAVQRSVGKFILNKTLSYLYSRSYLNLSIKYILKVSQTTLLCISISFLEILFVAVDPHDSVN